MPAAFFALFFLVCYKHPTSFWKFSAAFWKFHKSLWRTSHKLLEVFRGLSEPSQNHLETPKDPLEVLPNLGIILPYYVKRGKGDGPLTAGIWGFIFKSMIERLTIKNFLCLKDVDIEVKDFLVLIGPQASGKSLCAKLLYFFRTILEEMPACSMKSTADMPSDLKEDLSNKFESFFPEDYWLTQEFYMEYKRQSHTYFTLKKKQNQDLEIDFGEKLKAGIGHILKRVKGKQTDFSATKNIFIPAGRSFFSLLQKNIFRFMQTNNHIDPFLLEFGVFYEDIRPIRRSIPAEAQTLIHAILKGDYVPEENLLLAEGRKISLELLSSGQQEALPLALVFGHILSLSLESYDITNIYVEEPEAHLFPDAQETISRLISFLQYTSKQKISFFITTHSPYILTAFNNLIAAGNIVKYNSALKEAVCKEIPDSMHIDIDRFAAYTLEDGRAVSIIDKENNLINAEAIDGVSEIIGETFGKLLDLEFENGKDGGNV